MEIPERIREKFEMVKQKYPFYVTLNKINNRFYLYRRSSAWDKTTKRVISISEYLGRFTTEGAFLEKQKRNRQPKTAKQEVQHIVEDESQIISNVDKKILSSLSMNGRISRSFLAKQLGMSEAGVLYKVKQLEGEYGIKYTAEIDIEKLGYLRFLIFVKFMDLIPSVDELTEVFAKNPRVQLAFLTKGDYDLIIYALAKNVNSEEVIDLIVSLRNTVLSKYRSEWRTTPFYEHFGYVPLRNEFIESLKGTLLDREYVILKVLNRDGSINFTDIDKEYSFDKGRADYTYHKLRENGIIKRITISMHKLPLKYIGIIFAEIIEENKFRNKRASALREIINEAEATTNKYVLAGDIANPDGYVDFIPIFHEGAFDTDLERIGKYGLGIRVSSSIVTTILTGNFCYRWLDIAHSKQYNILVDKYKLKPVEVVDYDETGRKTKPAKQTIGLRGEMINLHK